MFYMLNKFNRKMYRLNSSNIFYSAFAIYVSCFTFSTTTFSWLTSIPVMKLARILVYCMLIYKVVFLDKFDFKEIYWVSLMLIVGILVSVISTNRIILDFALFAISIKGTKFDNILDIYIIINFIFVVLAVACSHLGLIENLEFVRNSHSRVRYSNGFTYATDFMSRLFYMLTAIVIRGKFKQLSLSQFILDLALIYLVISFAFFSTDARIDYISIVFLFLLAMYSYFYKSNCRFRTLKCFDQTLKFISKHYLKIFTLLITMPIILTYLYDGNNRFLVMLDKLITSRLKYGSILFKRIGVGLFGNPFVMNGLGRKSYISRFMEYNFIDSSFVLLLVRYGLVVFILIWLLNVYIQSSLHKLSPVITCVLLLIVANSTVSHHYIELGYNYTLLLAPWLLLNSDRSKE